MNLMYKKLNSYFLFVTLLSIAIINGYFFNYVNNTYFHYKSNENGLAGLNETIKFLAIVFISPIIETFVVQYLPHIILRKLGVEKRILLILIPSIIFGIFHFYFWLYALAAFVGGIIINLIYLNFQSKTKYYLFIVILFHLLYNLYGYLFVV